MLFTIQIETLLNQYIADPNSVQIEDIIPLIDYLEQQSIKIPDQHKQALHKNGEIDVADIISATTLIHANKTPSNNRGKKASILTIGVHGNEIYAGAICALEILKAQKEGKLEGDVVLQLGNIHAIRGYLNEYDRSKYYTERSGWRSTYGDELATQTLSLADGRKIEVKDDMNRVPRESLTIPRGLNANVDRAQDIVWTARALEHGLLPNADNVLAPASKAFEIGFILHPHTSRSPNGITNLSLPAKTLKALENGDLGKPFIYTPDYMMNIIQWVGNGLGGAENATMTALVSTHIKSAPLIVTVELGNHEDIKTPSSPSLINTSKIFTAGLMEACGVSEESHLKKTYNLAAKPHRFNRYKAHHRGLKFFELDGFDKLTKDDVIYPARLMDDAERQSLSLLDISRGIVLVDAQGHAEVLDAAEARKAPEKVLHADKAYHQLWPFELEQVQTGETLFLGIDAKGQSKELKSHKDFYAIFPWAMRKFLPMQFDPDKHDDLWLYNSAESKQVLSLPARKKGISPDSPSPQNSPSP